MEVAGIITGSIGAAVAVITVVLLIVRGVFTVEHRLTRLETQMEPFWHALQQMIPQVLGTLAPPTNPVSPERWQYLLNRLQNGQITSPEAQELQGVLVEIQQSAKYKNDLTALLAIALGFALLALLVNKK